jgi:hypothetical protein
VEGPENARSRWVLVRLFEGQEVVEFAWSSRSSSCLFQREKPVETVTLWSGTESSEKVGTNWDRKGIVAGVLAGLPPQHIVECWHREIESLAEENYASSSPTSARVMYAPDARRATNVPTAFEHIPTPGTGYYIRWSEEWPPLHKC